MSLRAGAPVRLAGVHIGSVRRCARPELKEAPAEVVMLLTPSYELNIPGDSTVSLETAGVLGETYVEINVGHASGPTIGSNAVLRAVATPQITTQDLLRRSETFCRQDKRFRRCLHSQEQLKERAAATLIDETRWRLHSPTRLPGTICFASVELRFSDKHPTK
jgi:hypothetical protein